VSLPSRCTAVLVEPSCHLDKSLTRCGDFGVSSTGTNSDHDSLRLIVFSARRPRPAPPSLLPWYNRNCRDRILWRPLDNLVADRDVNQRASILVDNAINVRVLEKTPKFARSRPIPLRATWRCRLRSAQPAGRRSNLRRDQVTRGDCHPLCDDERKDVSNAAANILRHSGDRRT